MRRPRTPSRCSGVSRAAALGPSPPAEWGVEQMLSQVPPRARAGWFGGSAASGGSRAAVQPGPESAPHRAAPRGARVRPEPARRSRGEVVGARAAGGRPGSRRQCLPGSQEAREAGEERRARPALGAAARLRRRASKDESAAPETAAPTPKAAPEPRDPARLGPGRREAARTPRCPQPGETIAARWVTSPRAGGCLCLRPRSGDAGTGRGAPSGGSAGGGRWHPGGHSARGGRGCRRRSGAAGLSPTGVQVWARPGRGPGSRAERRRRSGWSFGWEVAKVKEATLGGAGPLPGQALGQAGVPAA